MLRVITTSVFDSARLRVDSSFIYKADIHGRHFFSWYKYKLLVSLPLSLSVGFARSLCDAPQSPPNCNARQGKYAKMTTLENLNFDNLALRALPLDPVKDNYVRTVNGACFSRIQPTPVENPETVAISLPALELLDLDEEQATRPEAVEYFSGNKLLPGSETAAHCYCGHQFGHFSGQLGDGAAIYLGEIVNKKQERWEIQLKGAGPTPYSRTADGRKVLRSTIREFLCSEAMHHLGVPTTRAGICVTSDTKVTRDIFYSGNIIEEKATLVLRIAPTFIRFGSFEIFKTMDLETGRRGPSLGRVDILKTLTEYTIKTFYPQIWETFSEDLEQTYLEFYKEIVLRTARLVAKWQSVGWCHGVLNTDNMSIVGVTIDYGPYGFMDAFDPGYVCNGSDNGGRYSYEKQPSVCHWNLMKLAEALQPLVAMEKTKELLKLYDEEFNNHWLEIMRKKLGLLKTSAVEDKELIQNFFDTMEATGADFTNSFRCLSGITLPGSKDHQESVKAVHGILLQQSSSVEEMRKLKAPRMDVRQLQMFVMLMQVEPALLQQVGQDAKGLERELQKLETFKSLKDTSQVKKSSQDAALWDKWLEKYVARLEKEAERVSNQQEANQLRKITMDNTNPRFILRNYIAQNAIEAAEKGDYSEVQRLLKILQAPYSDDVDISELTSQPQDGSTAVAKEQGASQSSLSLHQPRSFSGLAYDEKPPLAAMDLTVT